MPTEGVEHVFVSVCGVCVWPTVQVTALLLRVMTGMCQGVCPFMVKLTQAWQIG